MNDQKVREAIGRIWDEHRQDIFNGGPVIGDADSIIERQQKLLENLYEDAALLAEVVTELMKDRDRI